MNENAVLNRFVDSIREVAAANLDAPKRRIEL